MQKRTLLSCLVCCGLLGGMATAQEELSPPEYTLEQYTNARTYRLAQERYDLALSYIREAGDAAAAGEALKDLVRYSKAFGKDAESLAEVETLLGKTSPGTELYGRANLAKARLLMRLGQNSEAVQLFRQGVVQRWKDNAFWEMNDSFLETNQQTALAIDEYHRNATDEYDKATRSFYGVGADLSVFFIRLREAKLANPNMSAMEDVFAHLEPSAWRPHVLDTAKALCLAFDNRVDEALALLDEVERNVRELDATKNEQEEWKYLPFYRAQILFLHSTDYDAARTALQEYIDRNPTDPNLVMNRTLEYIYSLDDTPEGQKKVAEVTSFILQSELFTNEEMKQLLPDHQIASVYDKHQLSLGWRGDVAEAERICKFVMDNYYPQTVAGANCAMNYAKYISSRTKDDDKAIELFKDILLNAPYDSIVPWVKHDLAEFSLRKEEFQLASDYAAEVMRLIPADADGRLFQLRQNAIRMKSYADSKLK